MKILYVVTQGEGGGAQKYALDLAKSLGGQIAMGTESDSLAFQAEDVGVKIHRLYHLQRAINPLEDMLAFWDLAAVVRQEQPDIVHLNSSKAGFLGSFLKLFFKVKIVYTAHGFVFNEPMHPYKRNFYIMCERLASRFRDYIIAVSERDLQTSNQYRVIPGEKISVIHNGISEIQFLNKTSARQYLGLPLDKVVIGTIANFYPTKGLDILIQAFARLKPEERQHLCVSIVGEGGQQGKIERLIQKLGLQDNFKFAGHRELASHYLRGFDIFVLPSRKEGFPYAILEAMQAGLPIIASDVGGVREALGETGILIPAEDSAALANSLRALVFGSGPNGGIEKLRQMSEAALLRSQNFTLDKMVLETKKIYDFLLTRV